MKEIGHIYEYIYIVIKVKLFIEFWVSIDYKLLSYIYI